MNAAPTNAAARNRLVQRPRLPDGCGTAAAGAAAAAPGCCPALWPSWPPWAPVVEPGAGAASGTTVPSPDHRVTLPSEVVWVTVNGRRSTWGSGPISRYSVSTGGGGGASAARVQITDAVAVVRPVPWMPGSGSVTVRVMILGAQSGTVIG